MNIEKFQRLRETVERLTREKDKAEGALSQLREQLKIEFNCQTIKEAKELHEKLTKEQEREEKKLEQDMAEFESKWSSKLETEE